jgi:peptidoglycan hydrolase-like protein with peptidoglycan-binding domain
MKRIYYATGRRLGYRTWSAIEGSDVVELKRMLHSAGYWRKDGPPIPERPVLDFDRGLLRTDPARLGTLFDEFDKTETAYDKAWAVYDGETVDAVDAFRKDHGLDHEGNPRGLVDAALVEALRAIYFVRGGP